MSLPLALAYPCLTQAPEENLPCQLLEVSLGDISCAWTSDLSSTKWGHKGSEPPLVASTTSSGP